MLIVVRSLDFSPGLELNCSFPKMPLGDSWLGEAGGERLETEKFREKANKRGRKVSRMTQEPVGTWTKKVAL